MVSIIVPVYNSEKYLQECIESIIKQSYTSIEIILVDDGSTDKSGELCDSLAENDKRIRVIHQKNGGAGAARNTGIEQAQGEYIQFVDSDDIVSPEITEKLIQGSEQVHDRMPVCGIDMQKEYQSEKWHKVQPFEEDNEVIGVERYLQQLARYKSGVFFGSPDNKLFCKKILKNNNIYFEEREGIGEDFVFNMKYLLHIKEVFICGECLYHYRYSNGSLSNNRYRAEKVWERQKKMYNSYVQVMERRGNFRKEQWEIAGFLMSSLKTVLVTAGKCGCSAGEEIRYIKQVVNDEICSDILLCKEWHGSEKIICFFIQKKWHLLLWIMGRCKGRR